MKTRKWYFLTTGVLILAIAALGALGALGFARTAVAAPAAERLRDIPGTEMTPLPDATCTVVGTIRRCHLYALPGSLTMPDGATVAVWGFADTDAGPALVPGPVIQANPGETLEIRLHNNIPGETVSLEFPGQLGLIPDLAGAAFGGTADYIFDVSTPGTFLYEAGLTSGGARQVAMGLYGALVVNDAAATWDQEVLLVFSEVDPFFNANPTGFSLLAFSPKYWLINGRAYPDTGWIGTPAGSTILMRYLNAGVEHHSIGLLGLDQEVLAIDGEALLYPQGNVAVPLAAGQTVETQVVVTGTAVVDTGYALYNASLHQHNNNQRLSDARAGFGGMLTFLRVTSGTTPSDLGPVASDVSVTPQKTNGAGGATLAATLTDDDTDVTAFEYFVDVLGSPGTGTLVTVGAPAPSVPVEVFFAPEVLATWPGGEHTLYIRGQDATGTWGDAGSAILMLDTIGPALSSVRVLPSPTNGTVNVVVRATADDRSNGNSDVVAAEYRIDGGAWQPMNLSRTGYPYVAVNATVPAATVAALAEGVRTFEVRAQDDLGNWTAPFGTALLRLDKTGPDVFTVRLIPDVLNFTLTPPATVKLVAGIRDPLVSGVRSPLVNAEAFIDTQGAPGTGFALFPGDGLFDEIVESVYYYIPSAQFATLAAGDHQVIVVGKDKAGNWGPPSSATITIIK